MAERMTQRARKHDYRRKVGRLQPAWMKVVGSTLAAESGDGQTKRSLGYFIETELNSIITFVGVSDLRH